MYEMEEIYCRQGEKNLVGNPLDMTGYNELPGNMAIDKDDWRTGILGVNPI